MKDLIKPLREFSQDTWIEPEEVAYGTSFKRRAYAKCDADAKHRICYCNIPDTYFSIPARANIKGRRVKGYLYLEDNVLRFREEKTENALQSRGVS